MERDSIGTHLAQGREWQFRSVLDEKLIVFSDEATGSSTFSS